METPTVDSTAATETQPQETQTPPPAEVVPKQEMERALKDMLKFKSEAKALEEKIKALELDRMKQSQDWQKIAELKETEAMQAKKEADQMREAIVFEKKYAAVREAAIKAGIRNEKDLDLFGLDDVLIETTSQGKINVLGADQFISKLKTERPYLFGGQAPKVNSSSPEVISASGTVSWDDIKKASDKASRTRAPGDYAVYRDLLLKYQQQQKTQ